MLFPAKVSAHAHTHLRHVLHVGVAHGRRRRVALEHLRRRGSGFRLRGSEAQRLRVLACQRNSVRSRCDTKGIGLVELKRPECEHAHDRSTFLLEMVLLTGAVSTYSPFSTRACAPHAPDSFT
jgi:hypothetical protein